MNSQVKHDRNDLLGDTSPTAEFEEAGLKGATLPLKHDNSDTNGSCGTIEIHSPTDALSDFVAVHVQKTMEPAEARHRH